MARSLAARGSTRTMAVDGDVIASRRGHIPASDRMTRLLGMRILLIEDDADTATYVVDGLKAGGHVADVAPDGREGLILATGGAYDVIVVDRMLPGFDGLVIVKSLRGSGIETPVLFLTARAGIDDRVEGLNAGGDDYLTKPFAFSELMARLNALVRRPPFSQVKTTLRVADLEMDLLGRKVRRGPREIDLQPREFRLLEYLMRNADHVVTRTMLLEHVWEFHFDPKTKIVETQISRLRSKIDRGTERELIHTIRGSGYVIRAPS
jgi:two-component system OmpR family response regulator